MKRLLWGIVGVGVAGRARARAVQAHPDTHLVGVHRGRYARQCRVRVFEDVSRLFERCDVVAICTPDETHAAWAHAALDHRCHVVIEYPAATSIADIRGIYEHADRVGRHVHVEHIELLSNTTRFMASQGPPRPGTQVTMTFRSRGAAWPDGRVHAWHHISRLHRLRAAYGPIRWIDTRIADGRRIRAVLGFEHGLRAHFDALRAPGGHRGIVWSARVVGGSAVVRGRRCFMNGQEQRPRPGPSLFLRDVDAMTSLLKGEFTYVGSSEVLAGAVAVDALASIGRTRLIGF